MLALLIILLLFFVYHLYIIIKYKKIPESWSETTYIFGKNKIYFTLYCFLITFLLLPLLFDHTHVNLQFIPFIFCIGLSFAGSSPFFKDNSQKIIHYCSAFVSFGGYILYMIFCMNIYWILSYIIILGILCLIKYKCYVYWAESLALLEILLFLYIQIRNG